MSHNMLSLLFPKRAIFENESQIFVIVLLDKKMDGERVKKRNLQPLQIPKVLEFLLFSSKDILS